jgi:hypothetical protein
LSPWRKWPTDPGFSIHRETVTLTLHTIWLFFRFVFPRLEGKQPKVGFEDHLT